MLVYHDLNGFDMVYALTEQTINNQFKTLWALGVLPSAWQATVANLHAIDVQLGAPSISFAASSSQSRQVSLSVPITSGTLTYALVSTDAQGQPSLTPQQVEIHGATLVLTASLNLAEVAAGYRELARIPAEVKAQLSTFDDSMFALSQIFMDLEDANLLNSFQLDTEGRVDTSQPTVYGQVRDLIQALIQDVGAGGSPYILGYSVTDKTPQADDATWRPTGVSFSLFPDGAYPLRNSLNYLLETMGKPVPGGGSGVFGANWVSRDDVQGSFVFSQDLVLNTILDALTETLPVTKDSFTTTDNANFTATFSNDIDGTTTITLSPSAGTNTIMIAFHATFHKKMHDKAGSSIGYVEGWINWVSTMSFTVDAQSNTVNVSVTNSVPETYKKNHPNTLGKIEHVLAVFADFVLTIITFGQVNDLFEKMVKSDWNTSIGTKMAVAMQSLRTRIILPAGSQLFFKDCRFLSDGTMLLTTTIQD